MAIYKTIVAYDGTDFMGFQRQAAGIRTVQGVLEDAISSLGWKGEDAGLKAAGRTDAGVHARGQVISYEIDWSHGTESLVRALNAKLPADVAVWHTELAAPGFHPRYSAQRRRYKYRIIGEPRRDPLQERFAWRVWPVPDLGAINTVAARIIGQRDFAPFGRSPAPGGHTVRRVFRADWKCQGNVLTFDIEGNAFLYHMVRRLVAAMVAVGQGRYPMDEMLELIDDPSNRWQGAIAPGSGLCLEQVTYPA